MSEPPSARRSQRRPLSCSNCARSKIRCSKTIPCLACIDRSQAETCRREMVQVTANSRSRKRPRSNRSAVGDMPPESADVDDSVFDSPPAQEPATSITPSERLSQVISTPPASSDLRPQGRAPIIQNDAAVTLEFLSHGRQSILRIGDGALRQQPQWAHSPVALTNGGSTGGGPWDLFFTLDQTRELLTHHQEEIAWMHNVVHMPTIRKELEAYISDPPYDRGWVALHYALICSTIYHADKARILDMGITPSTSLIQTLYNMCIQSIYDANFMAVHTLTSVQAICVLSQVAHNLDQSDLVQVLLSTAIRIAQSLGLNRLGPDREPVHLPEGPTVVQYLIDREVKKRTWWFLVRQDWLQIPFQNTFVIHANQFNTTMPLNCHEDESDMIQGGKVVVQPPATYTQTSYSNEIHKVAIVIWKHQDRMCAVGHPGNTREGVLRLYDQTLWADAELKNKYKEMPAFFKDGQWCSLEVPDYVKQLPSVHLLSTAHKVFHNSPLPFTDKRKRCLTKGQIYTVHRCFQLQSFRDKTFAYTQHSCVAISERCIKDVEKWPSNAATRMGMKMWTVITHIITCCINLTFASIFRNENALLYDSLEMQRLARVGREAIRPAEEWSSIARRGGVLLDALFDIDNSICWQTQFKIEDIVKKVLQVDSELQGGFSLAPEIEDMQFDFNIDWFAD